MIAIGLPPVFNHQRRATNESHLPGRSADRRRPDTSSCQCGPAHHARSGTRDASLHAGRFTCARPNLHVAADRPAHARDRQSLHDRAPCAPRYAASESIGPDAPPCAWSTSPDHGQSLEETGQPTSALRSLLSVRRVGCAPGQRRRGDPRLAGTNSRAVRPVRR